MKVVMEFDSVFWPANAEFINCTPLLGGSSNEARSCSRVGGDGGEIPSTYDDSMRGLLYSFWNLHMVHSKGKGKAGGNTAAVLVGFVLGDESCKLVAGVRSCLIPVVDCNLLLLLFCFLCTWQRV